MGMRQNQVDNEIYWMKKKCEVKFDSWFLTKSCRIEDNRNKIIILLNGICIRIFNTNVYYILWTYFRCESNVFPMIWYGYLCSKNSFKYLLLKRKLCCCSKIL